MGILDGRVVIVTGGGRGLGREYALQLARAGARVVVNDLGGSVDGTGSSTVPADQVVAEIRAEGGLAVANSGDVGDWDSCTGMVAQAVSEFGDLHVIVNNAGILLDLPLIDHDQARWERVLRVHLTGHAGLIRAAGRYWSGQPRQDRSIINSGSRVGLGGASSGQSSYAAAKAAIAMLTLVAGNELGDYGVRCNAVAPSAVTRLAGAHSGMQRRLAALNPGERERLGPAAVAPLVVALAAADCPITHEVFHIGGGTLHRYVPWSVDGELVTDTLWNAEQLATKLPGLVVGPGGNP